MQISATFLLFGDPAMALKVPLPRRPAGLQGAFNLDDGVELRWEAAVDCNGCGIIESCAALMHAVTPSAARCTRTMRSCSTCGRWIF